MPDATPKAEQLRQIISADQIQKRVKEKARQISDDFRGKTVHALGVLENGFVFMADLVRALEPPVVCTFVKPQYLQKQGGQGPPMLEIFSVTSSIFVGNTCCCWRDLCTGGNSRVPDERPACPGCGHCQIGSVAGPATGAPGAAPTRLLRLSG